MNRHLHRWFLPDVPDLVGLLERQGQVTVEGMQAYAAWAAGHPPSQADVRAAEHDADAVRKEVLINLRQAFSTPISPEDVFELSERLDAILNGAKNLVREADVLAMAPDRPIADMAALAADGVKALVGAFPLLVDDPDGATAAAEGAVRHQRRIERVYREAMRAMLQVENLAEAQARRELYRRSSRIGDALEHAAHRVWYAVVKEG